MLKLSMDHVKAMSKLLLVSFHSEVKSDVNIFTMKSVVIT